MNRFIAKHLFYFPIQRIRGQYVKKYLGTSEPNQHLATAELIALRNRKLRKLIDHAYGSVPFYKKNFDDLSIDPGDIQKVEDLEKLPVLQKRTILKNSDEMISPGYSNRSYTRKTGGSTGMTLHFKKDARALALNDAIMWRCYEWYNIKPGDRQVRFWGVPISSSVRWKEQLKDFILNRIRISAFEISEQACLEQYERIRSFKPDYFYGYTTAIYGFCLFMKKLGIDLNSLQLKAVICTAEKMYPHHEELFKEVFQCPVVDEYGSSENGIISFQCKNGNMHIMSDHLCIEFLDQDDNLVKDGELGRVVVTDLESYAMPLLRYDIGDIGRPSGTKCSCGVTLPVMAIVEGRKEDLIQTVSGKLIHAAYLCYTLKEDSVHEFKMYQKSIDSLLVQIVRSPLFDTDSELELLQNLKTALGDGMSINFEYLDRIPRERSGKLRYFVSELNKDHETALTHNDAL
jgi:phenylacetate-CoA ligase